MTSPILTTNPLPPYVGDIAGRTALGGVVALSAAVSEKMTAEWQKDAIDALASTTTAEQAFYKANLARTIAKVEFVPSAALTAHASNFATLTVKKRDANGANPATVAEVTTEVSGSGNWTAFLGVDFGVDIAALAEGWSLTVTIAKAMSGVAVPAGKLVVTFTEGRQKTPAEWHKDAADAAASTTTAEQVFYKNTTGVTRTFSKVEIIPAAALTADAANFATITVKKRDSAGANPTTVEAITTELVGGGGTGDWVAHVGIDFGTPDVVSLGPDESLTVTIAKTGTGVAVPISHLRVEFA